MYIIVSQTQDLLVSRHSFFSIELPSVLTIKNQYYFNKNTCRRNDTVGDQQPTSLSFYLPTILLYTSIFCLLFETGTLLYVVLLYFMVLLSKFYISRRNQKQLPLNSLSFQTCSKQRQQLFYLHFHPKRHWPLRTKFPCLPQLIVV